MAMTMTPKELRTIMMRLDPIGTQQQLAHLLGRTPRTLQRWLAGTRAISPEAAILLRLLARGRITITDIERASG
jgi:DNA-binding transcriptional regulator YdaS (Cro superfamily)